MTVAPAVGASPFWMFATVSPPSPRRAKGKPQHHLATKGFKKKKNLSSSSHSQHRNYFSVRANSTQRPFFPSASTAASVPRICLRLITLQKKKLLHTRSQLHSVPLLTGCNKLYVLSCASEIDCAPTLHAVMPMMVSLGPIFSPN